MENIPCVFVIQRRWRDNLKAIIYRGDVWTVVVNVCWCVWSNIQTGWEEWVSALQNKMPNIRCFSPHLPQKDLNISKTVSVSSLRFVWMLIGDKQTGIKLFLNVEFRREAWRKTFEKHCASIHTPFFVIGNTFVAEIPADIAPQHTHTHTPPPPLRCPSHIYLTVTVWGQLEWKLEVGWGENTGFNYRLSESDVWGCVSVLVCVQWRKTRNQQNMKNEKQTDVNKNDEFLTGVSKTESFSSFFYKNSTQCIFNKCVCCSAARLDVNIRRDI